jgi:hypothetical protein
MLGRGALDCCRALALGAGACIGVAVTMLVVVRIRKRGAPTINRLALFGDLGYADLPL